MFLDMIYDAMDSVSMAVRRGTRRRDNRLWGDGLLGQSLTTAWYAPEWRDVSIDELVLYYPTLARIGHSTADDKILSDAIGQALKDRIACAVRSLCMPPDGAAAVLERIAACGVVSDGALLKIPHGQSDWSEPPIDELQSANMRRIVTNISERWIFELSVLTCIDRMQGEISAVQHQAIDKAFLPLPTLVDALIAAIHTGINSAYVYPQFAFAHGLLGTGAWLGVVLKGRPALMPLFVAEVFEDYLGGTGFEDAAETDPLLAVLIFHTDLAGGVNRFVCAARKARARGVPVRMTGRSSRVSPSEIQPCVWNEPLFAKLRSLSDASGTSRFAMCAADWRQFSAVQ